MSNYSFIDQVMMFNNAKEIIGLRKTAFANLVFCKPKTKIIEIQPDTAGNVIKNLAISNDLNYFDITSKPKTINLTTNKVILRVNINIIKQILVVDIVICLKKCINYSYGKNIILHFFSYLILKLFTA